MTKLPLDGLATGSPHVLLLLADDLGWGDLSGLGHPTSRTPHLDSLMASSVLMTSMYSASPVCSPSRAALMTGETLSRMSRYWPHTPGQYPVTTGVWPGVFTPGWWHLIVSPWLWVWVSRWPGRIRAWGSAECCITLERPQLLHLPHRQMASRHRGQGTVFAHKTRVSSHPLHRVNNSNVTWVRFDHYLGIPYSHDMCPCHVCFTTGNVTCHGTCRPDTVSCPLYRDEAIIQQPADLTSLDSLYTREAVKYIEVSGSHGVPRISEWMNKMTWPRMV